MPVNEQTDTHQDELQKVEEELNVKFEKWFCSGCGRFLLDYTILEGTVIRKCKRCKRLNVLDIHGVELVES